MADGGMLLLGSWVGVGRPGGGERVVGKHCWLGGAGLVGEYQILKPTSGPEPKETLWSSQS